MSTRSESPVERRLRWVVWMALFGAAAGYYVGLHWETRADPPSVQHAFVHDYLPARIAQSIGITPLRERLLQPQSPVTWQQQFAVDPQNSYWRSKFAGCVHGLEIFMAGGALLFATVAWWLTRRRWPNFDGTATHHVRRIVSRPWD